MAPACSTHEESNDRIFVFKDLGTDEHQNDSHFTSNYLSHYIDTEPSTKGGLISSEIPNSFVGSQTNVCSSNNSGIPGPVVPNKITNPLMSDLEIEASIKEVNKEVLPELFTPNEKFPMSLHKMIDENNYRFDPSTIKRPFMPTGNFVSDTDVSYGATTQSYNSIHSGSNTPNFYSNTWAQTYPLTNSTGNLSRMLSFGLPLNNQFSYQSESLTDDVAASNSTKFLSTCDGNLFSQNDHKRSFPSFEDRSPPPNNLTYRNVNCTVHNKTTVFYCEICKIAICGICSVFAVGEHHDHIIKPKKAKVVEGETRVDVVKRLNEFMRKVCMKLQDAEVRIPFVLSHEDGHLIFNENRENYHAIESSEVLCQILASINNMIRHVSDFQVNFIDVNYTLEIAKKNFDDLQEFKEEALSPCRLPIASAEGGPSAEHCLVKGQGTFEVIANKETCFYLLIKNKKGETCLLQDVPLDINAVFENTANTKKVAVTRNSHVMNGVVKVSFKFPNLGLYSISVRVNSCDVPNSPLRFYAKNESKFYPGMVPVTSLGDSESFNKPYGVCVDKEFNVYISDRCNNCIKVFSKDLSFKKNIGESGKGIGQLLKPSGIAIDKENNLVVCDKDNHRIQVFTSDGKFLRCSEQKVRLSFPWSVAVNSVNQYVITHLKHSICLMSSRLQILKTFDLTYQHKHFSSSGECIKENVEILNPRGVCVGYMDEILVTDFESGTVYSVDGATGKTDKAITATSSLNLQKRFQGITLDKDGYLIVADSKNERIEVFTYSGELVSSWSVPGKPLYVAELPKNRYIVTVEDGKTTSVLIYAKGSDGGLYPELCRRNSYPSVNKGTNSSRTGNYHGRQYIQKNPITYTRYNNGCRRYSIR